MVTTSAKKKAKTTTAPCTTTTTTISTTSSYSHLPQSQRLDAALGLCDDDDDEAPPQPVVRYKRGDTVMLESRRRGKQMWKKGPVKIMSANGDGSYDVRCLTTSDTFREVDATMLSSIPIDTTTTSTTTTTTTTTTTNRKKRLSIKKEPYSPSVIISAAADAKIGKYKHLKRKKSGSEAGV